MINAIQLSDGYKIFMLITQGTPQSSRIIIYVPHILSRVLT